MSKENVLARTKTMVDADEDALFAISLDRLAYAKDNYRLGTDLVRTFIRHVRSEDLAPGVADDVARLRRGMRVLTGRTPLFADGIRYGTLAVNVRDAGGHLFQWATDEQARTTVQRIGAADSHLAGRIAGRSAA